MDHWYIDSWQHLMGPLDQALEDARANAATLDTTSTELTALLARAEQERDQAHAALTALSAHRVALAGSLEEIQRTLAVAGVPLRGEIT